MSDEDAPNENLHMDQKGPQSSWHAFRGWSMLDRPYCQRIGEAGEEKGEPDGCQWLRSAIAPRHEKGDGCQSRNRSPTSAALQMFG